MQAVLRIPELPSPALDAAAAFHGEWLPRARVGLTERVEALVLVFPGAPFDHAAWRQAAVAGLAREAAPSRRVNAVAGDDEAAITATLAWLARAPGITGQVFTVDGTGAGFGA